MRFIVILLSVVQKACTFLLKHLCTGRRGNLAECVLEQFCGVMKHAVSETLSFERPEATSLCMYVRLPIIIRQRIPIADARILWRSWRFMAL